MDLDCPAGIERGFYGRFSKLLWSVFHGPCKVGVAESLDLGHSILVIGGLRTGLDGAPSGCERRPIRVACGGASVTWRCIGVVTVRGM